MDWAQVVLALGLGGAVGAAAGVWTSVRRAQTALATFHQELSTLLTGAQSPEAQRVRQAFVALESELATLSQGLAQLRRALRWK